jgi:hypothetical protein
MTVNLPPTWVIAPNPGVIRSPSATTHPSNRSKPWPNYLLNVISQLKYKLRLIYRKVFFFSSTNFPSTIVSTPRFNSTASLIPGGTIETEMRNISGQEITRAEFTPVNVESREIVLILRLNVIVTRVHQLN